MTIDKKIALLLDEFQYFLTEPKTYHKAEFLLSSFYQSMAHVQNNSTNMYDFAWGMYDVIRAYEKVTLELYDKL